MKINLALALLALCFGSAAHATCIAGQSFCVESFTVTPTNVQPGGTVTVTVSLQSVLAVSNMIADVELSDSTGTRLASPGCCANQSPVSFNAGQTIVLKPMTFTVPKTATALGSYVFKAGLFTAGWKSNPFWTNAAGQFLVTAATPVTPPVTPVTPITPPATAPQIQLFSIDFTCANGSIPAITATVNGAVVTVSGAMCPAVTGT